jgi:threonyl-tRNA synthetase
MENINFVRHSLSHVMAMAVKKIYPKVIFGIGPTIENGFYYDFGIQTNVHGSTNKSSQITEADLLKIEKEIRSIIKQNLDFVKEEKTFSEAEKIFKNEPYKLELIHDLKEEGEKKVSIYKTGDFVDLCKGPHVKNTKEIDANGFKLMKLAGAYWKGSENNAQLQRIYGVAFESKNKLDIYLKLQEEIEKRDHRLLGQQLDLFHIDDEVGPGLILWHPKGALLKRIIETYVLDRYLEEGYQLLNTPHIANLKLWKTSGHTGFYKDSMFPSFHMAEIDKEEKGDYQLKPMNCPFHMKIYKSSLRSYRELPLRYTELGTVYRYEKSGTLHGLVRVRGFTQDDAHIFCAGKDQLLSEIIGVIRLTKDILTKFDFKEYEVRLSVRDSKNKDKYLGSEEGWNDAESILEKALKQEKWEFERDEGEAVFYGPKIDIKVKDELGRTWQISTIQIDFNLPEKFDLSFINAKSEKERPFVVHRALLGSLERFMGVLIENYGGAFPMWLSPVQIKILPISDKHLDYGREIVKELKASKIRVELDERNETIGKKIREAEMQKTPYTFVIGDQEVSAKTVRIRERGKGDIGEIKIKDFLEKILPSL